MFKSLKEILANFLEFYRQLDKIKQLGVLGVIVAIFTCIIWVMMWMGQTQYKVLYSNLSKEDSLQVTRFLKEANIPHMVEDDGKTLKIPEQKVEILRLEIAKSGMSFTSVLGYEVFDKQSFGTSSFVQKVNKQRALEGELMKTINHIKGVRRSRIHLSIPDSSPFAAEKKPPSASVVLELKSGYTMTPEEIKGVSSLVASSVEGMRTEHVVILDHRGKKLSDNTGDSVTAETANRLALEGKFNRRLEGQIEEILAKVVGEGKVVAKVSVKMDYTQTQETRTTYDNENAAVLSEVKNTQKLAGSRPSPQGIPGARSNLPGEQPQPGVPETKNNVDKEFTNRNFNVPARVTRSKNPGAIIKAITAAVMVDGKRVIMKDEGGNLIMDDKGYPKINYEPWSEVELNNFKDIVETSIGVQATRGDKIVIKNMKFAEVDLSAADAILAEKEKRDLLKNLVKYLVVGIIVALFFFVIIKPFIQWVTDNSIESIEDFLPKTIEELENVQANQKLPGLEDALPAIEESLNPEKIEGNMLREKVINLVEQDPAKAAQVVYNMIHYIEDDSKVS